MEKLSIFSKIILIFKILLSLVFLGFISLVIFFFYFSNKEARFAIAEGTQGSQLSQFIFTKLTKDFPTYSDAFFEKSVPYNKRGYYYQGFQLLNRAVELNPKEHLGYRGWIKLNKLKDYEGTIKDFEKLDSLIPNYFDVNGGSINYLLAVAYQGADNFEKSRISYEKLFKEDEKQRPVFPISYVNYGILLRRMGLQKQAIKQFDISLNKSNYKYAESYYNKALIYKQLGNRDSAQILLKKSLNSYDQGYKISNIYNEAFNELYRDDIIKQIK